MKRAFVIVLVLAAAAAAALGSAGAGGEAAAKRYTVELDNAFGLVEGADLKIAGVRAGKIKKMRIDRRTKHALIDFDVTKAGFGSLRTDVFCETRPQSLIGEYFIDCRPGTDPQELEEGSVISVTQTASTVAPDLVNSILDRPYRERLRIILNELGAGVGSRGADLNEAIRRASPALRETDRVLLILARQNRILADLVRDGDEVIGDLAGNKEDVSRWVKEAGETAAASAERREDIAAGLRKLPAFLRELRPTMAELGGVADAQAPSLSDLNASAGELEKLLTNLAPFSRSTQVNLRSLAGAARQGRPAVKAAAPVVKQLGQFAEKTPELAQNLAIVGEHLDDRRWAAEADPRAPEGKGYTGFEAVLQYVFDQTMSINIYDANHHLLKANLFVSECTDYQNADSLKEHMAENPDFLKKCGRHLGPNQQGVTTADPTKPAQARSRRPRRKATERTEPSAPAPAPEATLTPDKPAPDAKPPVSLQDTVQDILDDVLPGAKLPDLDIGGLDKPLGGITGRDQRPGSDDEALLDFLFGS